MIVYCQAHGGSHYLRDIRRFIADKNTFKVVMNKASGNFPLDGELALVRDPRDRFISQYRFWVKKKPGKIQRLEMKYPDLDQRLAHMMLASDGKKQKITYIDATKKFVDVISAANCRIIKFEDLVCGGKPLAKFLKLIGSSDDPSYVYKNAFGRSRTFTGQFSNHKDWFGPECHELWNQNQNLLKALGYE